MKKTNIIEVRPVKLPKVNTEKQIGWYNDDDEPINVNEYAEEETGYAQTLLFWDGKNSLQIQYENNELPFCCGVRELGELSMDKGIPQKYFDELMLALLSKINRTMIINTNGTGSNANWEGLLLQCPYFTKVKQFVNPSSKRTIKMWISNNAL